MPNVHSEGGEKERTSLRFGAIDALTPSITLGELFARNHAEDDGISDGHRAEREAPCTPPVISPPA